MPNLELVLALLGAATLLAGLARLVNVPYPVVLVVGGAVLAAIPGVPTVRIAPNVVFLVFLPPLVYSAAVFTSPAELRYDATAILILAVGLVLATVAAVAAVAHAATGLTWSECFVLGAILGATDPLAATAIIRRLGAPQRIATLLEGEALVNDGTSLTAFKVTLGAVGVSSFSAGHGVAQLVEVSLGGVVIGIAVGGISALVRGRFDDAELEVTIGLLTAYAAYIAADAAGTSGVLSAVAAGLVTSRVSHRIFSPGTRLRNYGFWEVASFVLNALLFLLIGLQLRSVLEGIPGIDAGSLAAEAAAVVAALIVLRMAWMFLIPTVVGALGRTLFATGRRESWRHELVLGWSGMRGALSLAAALSLPLDAHGPFAHGRGLVIFLAFAAIFVTLVLQGITLGPLIRVLGLSQNDVRRRQATEARLRILRAALTRLDALADEGALSEHSLARLRDYYEFRTAALEQRLQNRDQRDRREELIRERAARRQLLSAEREVLRRLAAERAAPAEILREIERELDLESTRLQ